MFNPLIEEIRKAETLLSITFLCMASLQEKADKEPLTSEVKDSKRSKKQRKLQESIFTEFEVTYDPLLMIRKAVSRSSGKQFESDELTGYLLQKYALPKNQIKEAIEAICIRKSHIDEFLSLLPEWNGKDHINSLVSYFDTDKERFEITLKKWLVNAFNNFTGGLPNRYGLILSSEVQNIGKDRFIEWLCGFSIYKFYFTDKSHIALTSSAFLHIEELGGIKRKDITELKRLLSEDRYTGQLKYENAFSSRKRIGSFIGSMNANFNFIDDMYNSRFVIIPVTGIDWNGYAKNVDILQLWSQVRHLHRSGFDFQFTKEELATNEKEAEVFRSDTVFSEWMHIFEVTEEPNEGLTSSEILKHITEAMIKAGAYGVMDIAKRDFWHLKKTIEGHFKIIQKSIRRDNEIRRGFKLKVKG